MTESELTFENGVDAVIATLYRWADRMKDNVGEVEEDQQKTAKDFVNNVMFMLSTVHANKAKLQKKFLEALQEDESDD